MSAVSGKSEKLGICQENPFPHKTVRELSGIFDPFLQCQGNLTLFTGIQQHKRRKTSNLGGLRQLCPKE